MLRLFSISVVLLACSGDRAPRPVPVGTTEDAVITPAPPPCSTYRHLPSRVARNTVIEDACLDVPAGTTVRLGQDVHLIIIATRELRLGANARIDARGGPGGRGAPADRAVEAWAPAPPDEAGQIACACGGHACASGWSRCTAEGMPQLAGHRGEPGGAGGRVDIVARAITIGAGATIDVSGGAGGAAGASGRVECAWQATRCAVTAPDEGRGTSGADGSASFEVGTADALAALASATRPPTAALTGVVDTDAALRAAIATARDAGRIYDHLTGRLQPAPSP